MIVQRNIVTVKPGKTDKFIEYLNSYRVKLDNPGRMRILSACIGVSMNTVVYELIADTVEENIKRWEEWYADPENQDWFEEWIELVDDNIDEYYYILD